MHSDTTLPLLTCFLLSSLCYAPMQCFLFVFLLFFCCGPSLYCCTHADSLLVFFTHQSFSFHICNPPPSFIHSFIHLLLSRNYILVTIQQSTALHSTITTLRIIPIILSRY